MHLKVGKPPITFATVIIFYLHTTFGAKYCFVPSGALDHLRCGDKSLPEQPKPLYSCFLVINSPCEMSLLDNVKDPANAEAEYSVINPK